MSLLGMMSFLGGADIVSILTTVGIITFIVIWFV
jgi:hypothetical protein